MEAPSKLRFLFRLGDARWEHYSKRYFPIYGGRGSAKTETIGRAFILISLQETCTILCCREYQNSIEESVYKVLIGIIEDEGLSASFTITKNKIISENGSEFIFKGLKKENVSSLKSIKGVKYVWVEEAQYVSHDSWRILDPSIREENSKIIPTFNRELEYDPVWELYCDKKRDDVLLTKMNFKDNPFFPKSLKGMMEYDQQHRPHLYPHIWLGEPLGYNEARVFGFNPEINLVDQEIPYQENVETCLSFDFGVQDDTAIGFYQVLNVPQTAENPKGLVINIFDEYINNNQGAEHYRDVVDGKGYKINNVYGDPSGANRDSSLNSWIDRISRNPKSGIKDWHFIYHNKYSPTEMIDLVNEFIPYVRINRQQCPRFYDMFMKWCYRTDKAGNVIIPAKPMHDEFSHPGTSFYYFIAFRFGMQRKTNIGIY